MARIGDSLAGKRVYVTQIDEFMGPALVDAFRAHDAAVLGARGAEEAALRATGHIDVLVCNLGVPAPSTRAHEVGDAEWRSVFAGMVDPLPRLFRAVLPQMLERRAGKIVVMGSATALRGQKRTSTYAAARGAQLAYVRAVGAEVAAHNVQVNLIAQNFIENPMYYPPEVQALPAFRERLKREVPANRLGTAQEDALFAVFLASNEVCFITGQAIPFSGGWVG
ncbi:MAG TPA: SDR family oxidoreductase [Burkholderiales bacterium]|nr:SDR family oxidoreductase [Burkholderiales bacterium]